MENRFKIVSDGSIKGGTKVFAPDGTDLSEHVRAVKFEHHAGEMATVLLEIIKPIVDVDLPADCVTVDVADPVYVNGGLERNVTSLADEEYRRYELAESNGQAG